MTLTLKKWAVSFASAAALPRSAMAVLLGLRSSYLGSYRERSQRQEDVLMQQTKDLIFYSINFISCGEENKHYYLIQFSIIAFTDHSIAKINILFVDCGEKFEIGIALIEVACLLYEIIFRFQITASFNEILYNKWSL